MTPSNRRPLGIRLYGAALRLLPASYDAGDRDAMLETFTRRREATPAGAGRRVLLLVRELGGVLRLVPDRNAARGGRISSLRTGNAGESALEKAHSPALGLGSSHRGRGPERRQPGLGALSSAWLQELGHAARRLRRAPGFTAATLLTLAVATGGNAAIFSVVHAILLEPLPYPDASELVAVRSGAPATGADDIEMTIGLYLHYRDDVASFRSIALYDRAYRNLTGTGEPARLETIRATGELFPTLGVEAALGRTLGPTDAEPGADAVVVLSNALWRARFGADLGILGRTVVMDDRSYTVVGVMPRGFDFPRPGTDAWTAWWIDEQNLPRMSFSYDAVARLAAGANIATADAEIARAIDTYPEAFGWDPAEWQRLGLIGFARPLKDHVVGRVGPTLALFAGAGLFVMLLACANVANLFLVRADSRGSEARIRSALGASRGQLRRYWMAEGICVATLAALLGLAIAPAGLGLIVGLAPDLPRIETVRVSGATLLFTATLAAAAALLFGSAPLCSGRRRTHPLGGAQRGATTSPAAQRGRELLIGTQVALALVLSIGAGLMLQSVRNLLTADPGFDPAGVLTFRVSLPAADYPDRAAQARFHESLVDRLGAVPGVESAGLARCMPLQGWCGGNPVASPDSPLPVEGFRRVVSVKPVSSGYLEAVRIPLLTGRTFVPSDASQRSGAAIVSESLAARIFPGNSPRDVLGKRIYPQPDLDVDRWFTVVGVVASTQRSRIDEPPAEVLYVPLLGVEGDRHLAPIQDVTVAVRVDGDPLAAIAPVRAALRELDPDLPIASIRTLADIHAAATARNRFTSMLLTLAAGTGLLLGGIGIYGVVSWTTRQRTAELGVRAALGARATDLLRMIMTRSMAVIIAGIAVGLAGSLATTRLLASLLYQVGANDPTTFAAVTLLLAAVGALATWLPARRAARIDPVEALRTR